MSKANNAVTDEQIVSALIGSKTIVVAEIMGDKENNAAVRLQAAQTILNTAVKFSERLVAAEAKAENAIWQERGAGAM